MLKITDNVIILFISRTLLVPIIDCLFFGKKAAPALVSNGLKPLNDILAFYTNKESSCSAARRKIAAVVTIFG
jgi:hypothetical protein